MASRIAFESVKESDKWSDGFSFWRNSGFAPVKIDKIFVPRFLSFASVRDGATFHQQGVGRLGVSARQPSWCVMGVNAVCVEGRCLGRLGVQARRLSRRQTCGEKAYANH